MKLSLLILFFSLPLFAHEGHHHGPHTAQAKTEDASEVQKKIFDGINSDYEKNIKGIFQQKCMDCHSNKTRYPVYYNWPIAKGLIDGDVAESKKHIDMTNGFPFGGHGTPIEDLEAIKKEIEEDEMPPLRYKLMHWGSSLTPEEKTKVLNWIDQSSALLKRYPSHK